MTDDTDSRTACPTPDKKRYATLQAADIDRINLADTRGRDLVAYDTCACGWVHLATRRQLTGPPPSPLGVEEVLALDSDMFNAVVRAEIRGTVHPETAKSLRHLRVALLWANALKLYQKDLNLQKQRNAAENFPGYADWLRRVDQVVRTTSTRVHEAQHIMLRRSVEKAPQPGNMDAVLLRSDVKLEDTVLKRVAGELAIDKLKRTHLEEFMYLMALEYRRFRLRLTPAMEEALQAYTQDETEGTP